MNLIKSSILLTSILFLSACDNSSSSSNKKNAPGSQPRQLGEIVGSDSNHRSVNCPILNGNFEGYSSSAKANISLNITTTVDNNSNSTMHFSNLADGSTSTVTYEGNTRKELNETDMFILTTCSQPKIASAYTFVGAARRVVMSSQVRLNSDGDLEFQSTCSDSPDGSFKCGNPGTETTIYYKK